MSQGDPIMSATSNSSVPTSATTPDLNFTFHAAAKPFSVSSRQYVEAHGKDEFGFIGTGALVFDDRVATTGYGTDANAVPRILLIQRAATDSVPNRWEVPGGACDDEDASILHGVARELWEETGLKAVYIGPPIGEPTLFTASSSNRVAKFCFVVEVENNKGSSLSIRLDSKEHQNFVWASEEDVREARVKDLKLEFVSQELVTTVLLAFKEISPTR